MTMTDDSIHTGDFLDADLAPAAALRLAGIKSWRDLTLDEIAAEARIELSVLAEHYTCKPEILDGFERMIDRRMLAGAAAGDIGDSPRDRVFDIIMERFDALLPYREGVARIARELPFDPASGLVLAMAMPRSASWMFAGARISVSGPSMPVKLVAMTGLYLSVFRIWLKDEDQDLSKTMAALDRQLDKIKPLFGREFDQTKASEAVEPAPEEPAAAPVKKGKKTVKAKAAATDPDLEEPEVS